MSCNGCRILRKGCSEDCILRQCLESIDNPQSQANATVFVAKFFGRAGLMSFLSSVSQTQRPMLFQSLLFEAVGRTVNPVSGAVGLLWTGNWHICQEAVTTVLRGGTVEPLEGGKLMPDYGNSSVCGAFRPKDQVRAGTTATTTLKRIRSDFDNEDVKFTLTNNHNPFMGLMYPAEKMREASPLEESETTTLRSGGSRTTDPSCCIDGGEIKLLALFV